MCYLHYSTLHGMFYRFFYCIFSVHISTISYENPLMSFSHYDKLFQETHLSILLLYKQKFLLLFDKARQGRIQPGSIDEHSDQKKSIKIQIEREKKRKREKEGAIKE